MSASTAPLRPARRPAAAALILTMLAGGCASGTSSVTVSTGVSPASEAPAVTATPAATSTPAPPSASPTPVPATTPVPGATPRATGPTAPGGATSYPAGATTVVFRYESAGGFMRAEWMAGQVPTLTLYGDGTVLYRSYNQEQPEQLPDQPLRFPPLLVARMTDDQVQAFLADVLQSGLAVAGPEYRNDLVADAPTSVFTLDANGIRKRVSIYALGLGGGPGGESPLLAGIAALAERLSAFETEVAAGRASDAGTYTPERYRATLFEGGGRAAPAIDWPWKDVGPDSFAQPPDTSLNPLPFRYVSAAQAALVGIADIEGGVSGLAVNVAGVSYSLGLRPALPDEGE